MKKYGIIFSFLFFLITTFMVNSSFGTQYKVHYTRIIVFSQSEAESTAHLIEMEEPIYAGKDHPWCGDRAYILLSDKELYATALAASLLGKKVHVIYEDAAEEKLAMGHRKTTCKVISIWSDFLP